MDAVESNVHEAEKLVVTRWVRQRIGAITTRPLMYASCREAYAAQLVQLLELVWLPGGKLYDLFKRRGPVYEDLLEPLDEAWAKKFGNAAREIAGLSPQP